MNVSRTCRYQWHRTHMEPDPADPIHNGPLDGERCDSCGHTDPTTLVRVVLNTGGTLIFCSTCWHRHEQALRETATLVRG